LGNEPNGEVGFGWAERALSDWGDWRKKYFENLSKVVTGKGSFRGAGEDAEGMRREWSTLLPQAGLVNHSWRQDQDLLSTGLVYRPKAP
jgi:hypothetical protein